jgi:hypothetical protein
MRLVSIAVAGCLSAVAAPADALPPIGFERWMEPPSFGVSYGISLEVVAEAFGSTSDTWWLNVIYQPGTFHTPFWRVMDIEIHEAPGNFYFEPDVADIVYVRNSGEFERETWVLYEMLDSYLETWPPNMTQIPLDIERYQHAGQTRWAVVVVRNPVKVTAKVMLEVTLEQIQQAIQDAAAGSAAGSAPQPPLYLRPLDIDFVDIVVDEPCHVPRGQACPWHALYDVVLVENSGDNKMLWNLEEGWDYEPHVTSAAQLVDVAQAGKFGGNGGSGSSFGAYLSVVVENDWVEHDALSAAQVNQTMTQMHERIIDLDLDPDFPYDATLSPEKWPRYHTVNLP